MRQSTDLSVVSLLLFAASAKAQSKSSLFEVKGNERTRTQYITDLAEACLEDRSRVLIDSKDQLLSLDQCLMNAKIFAKVSSTMIDERINITVEEKWTLIPAPFYQSSGSTRKAGLIVFETNFLGQGLTLALGANASNKGSGFFGFFTNPSVLGSRYFTSLSFGKESTIYELIERRDDVTDSFLEKNLSGNLSFGYRFPWLNLSTNVGRVVRSYESQENYLPPSDYSYNRVGFTADYDKRDYKLYFSDGIFARYRHSRSFGESGDHSAIVQNEASMSWQHDIYSDHALYLMLAGMNIKGGEVSDAERVGSAKGFRGIETRTAWARSYFTQTAEYQVPMHRFEKGTLTSAVFVDHGRLQNRGGTESVVDYTAGGIGIYFFLSRIALPGLGLEWGVNSEYQKSFVNFSIGLAY